jgi:hypothetical protein
MSKKKDDFDLVNYKIDALERRLDSLERLIVSMQPSRSSASESGLTSEILHVLLDMVRNPSHAQTPHTVTHQPISHQQAIATKSIDIDQQSTEQTQKNPTDLFSFQRRRTFV